MGKNRSVREVGPMNNLEYKGIMQPSQYRVFIIDDCGTLPPEWWSAISKVIDRAPRRMVFVLVNSSLDVLPHIIMSRCQKFFFPKLKDTDIIYTLQWISSKEYFEIDKDANAHDFIVKFPDGYDTNVGQFGFQLSRGQKQRVAIARALIRDSKILLLDEATSTLDSESERVVQKAIDHVSVGRTDIIIAHRLSTIRRSDLIYMLQSGKITESGLHNELMQTDDSHYFKMVQLQLLAPSTEFQSPHRRFVSASPTSVMSNAPNTPLMNLFCPGLSMSSPCSLQVDASFESDYEDN
ncbi:putative multidrug resistance protein [Tanacetum coccineum]